MGLPQEHYPVIGQPRENPGRDHLSVEHHTVACEHHRPLLGSHVCAGRATSNTGRNDEPRQGHPSSPQQLNGRTSRCTPSTLQVPRSRLRPRCPTPRWIGRSRPTTKIQAGSAGRARLSESVSYRCRLGSPRCSGIQWTANRAMSPASISSACASPTIPHAALSVPR